MAEMKTMLVLEHEYLAIVDARTGFGASQWVMQSILQWQANRCAEFLEGLTGSKIRGTR